MRRIILFMLLLCIYLLAGCEEVPKGEDLSSNSVLVFSSEPQQEGDEPSSSYTVEFTLDRLAVTELEGDIKTAPEQILEQIKNAKPYDSRTPNVLYHSFQSREDANDYVGLAALKDPSFDATFVDTYVSVMGTLQGEIQHVHIETMYEKGNVHLQFISELFTHNWDQELKTGSHAAEVVAYETEWLKTEGGLPCLVVRSSALQSGYHAITAYLTCDNILETLNISYLKEDSKTAQEALHAWVAQY